MPTKQTAAKKPKGQKPAVELRVYAEFSEVRTQVETVQDTLQLTFPQGVWDYVVTSSLGLLELPYSSVTHAEAPSWLKDMEGQRVKVRLDPLAPLQEATLERAADLLIKDENGYYRVREDQLVFEDAPREKTQNAARNITFRLHEPGEGTLTYLTRGVTWTPRYTLDAQQENKVGTLTALADITNNTEQAHLPDQLELIAGDVELDLETQSYSGQTARGGVMYAMAAPAPAPEMQELDELGGLYRYHVSNPPPLDPKATVSVAFLPDAKLEVEREARLETSFAYIGAQRGNFNRGYTVTATNNLPGGKMTIREDGHIVGQQEIQETPAGHPIRFTLGRDPDVTFTRTLQQKGAERDPDGTGKVRRINYQVTFNIKNNKKRPVQTIIRERHYDHVVNIEGLSLTSDNIATLSAKVEAGESVNLTYTVTVDR